MEPASGRGRNLVGYPLLGGVITLMPKEIADALYQAGNTFIIPDSQVPANTLPEFYLAIIETALFTGSPTFTDDETVAVMDWAA